MTTYLCETCPLVFIVGSHLTYRPTGANHYLVCATCGTLHRVRLRETSEDGGIDTALCTLEALAQPIRSMEEWQSWELRREKGNGHAEWIKASESHGRPQWHAMVCHACGTTGSLTKQGDAALRDKDGEPQCPVCTGSLHCVESLPEY